SSSPRRRAPWYKKPTPPRSCRRKTGMAGRSWPLPFLGFPLAGACGPYPPSVQPLTITLIPTYLSHVKRRFVRGHGARARYLSLSASAARGARGGAPVRRGAAAARPDQRPVLADDVAQ